MNIRIISCISALVILAGCASRADAPPAQDSARTEAHHGFGRCTDAPLAPARPTAPVEPTIGMCR